MHSSQSASLVFCVHYTHIESTVVVVVESDHTERICIIVEGRIRGRQLAKHKFSHRLSRALIAACLLLSHCRGPGRVGDFMINWIISGSEYTLTASVRCCVSIIIIICINEHQHRAPSRSGLERNDPSSSVQYRARVESTTSASGVVGRRSPCHQISYLKLAGSSSARFMRLVAVWCVTLLFSRQSSERE